MEASGDEVRQWATEAARSGMQAEEIAAELRSRWDLSPIPAIKILRDAVGIPLRDAKALVDATLPAEMIAAKDAMLDEFLDGVIAELTVEGALVQLDRDIGRGHWRFSLIGSEGSFATNLFDLSCHLEDAQAEALTLIGPPSRQSGTELTIAWDPVVNQESITGRLRIPEPAW